MNRNKLGGLFILLSFGLFAQNNPKVINIEKILAKMTLAEKVGQMSQIDLGTIANGDICNLSQPQSLNTVKLQQAVEKYHIGSILNVGCGSGTISLENWRKILDTIQVYNKRYSNNYIPIIYGIDAIHGNNYTKGATLFPQQIGQAATWNPSLVEKANSVSAYETRATGIPWNFSPVLDLGRQPLWSRFFETYGEDVYLAKTMTEAAIKGLQGDGTYNPYKVASCMKHFLGYSFSISGKDRTPIWIGDIQLREYFLPTFQKAIETGSKTIMINSGEINGIPVHANYNILTKLLREELKFTGVAVTDWEDIYKLVNVHHVAKDKKQAVEMAINAGIDMSMIPNDFEFCELLFQLVKEGRITEKRLNQSVRRILKLKSELGLFEIERKRLSDFPDFGMDKFSQISYETAAESITLLKNTENILPLSENQSTSILVCGPASNSLNLLNGAWTHTWQGVDTNFNTKNKLTILQAFYTLNSKVHIEYENGVGLDTIENLAECIHKAKNVDKIIICLGETPCTEIPGNIDDLTITSSQKRLVDEMYKLGKPIILVCCFNRPRIIHEEVKKANAILYGYLPGDEGGKAIVNTLFGRNIPNGKLPFTYPNATNNIVHYDRKGSENLHIDFSENGYRPEFDFGFGLSYSNFEYSDYSLSSDTLLDSIVVTISVKNTGKYKAKEVVQLYYKDLVASITPSEKKLTAFTKIELQPNEIKKVSFVVTKKNFAFVGKDLKYITEKGVVELLLNENKKRIYVL